MPRFHNGEAVKNSAAEPECAPNNAVAMQIPVFNIERDSRGISREFRKKYIYIIMFYIRKNEAFDIAGDDDRSK